MFYRSCALAVMMMVSASAKAESKAMSIDALNQMVSGLGYKTYGDKDYVAVDDLTGAGGTVFFALEDEGATLNIYKPFDTPTKEQMRTIPAAAMLAFNNAHPFAFAIGQADAKDRVVLQEFVDAGLVTPEFLRKQIDTLKANVDESKTLWDTSEWSKATSDKAENDAPAGAGTPEAFHAQIAKAAAIWEKTPFQLRNVMLVTEKAPIFGAYKPRGSSVFKPDETINIYCEPFGYAWQTTSDAQNKFDINIDFELMAGDDIVMGQKNAQSFNGTSRVKLTEFMANLYLNVKGLKQGKYSMRWIFHDKVAGKSAVATLPFEIAN